MYETINSPFKLGNVTLKNRIIFAPTSMGLKEDELLAKMEAIAAGGCAMIIIGDVPVGKKGFHSLFTRKGAACYRRLTAAAHEHGCLICAQLHQSDSDWKGMLRFLPGILTKRISHEELRRLLNEQISPYITALPPEKICRITSSFGSAALEAQKLGFDMVQVHGDRMCGSFSSSLYNKRQDSYGGSPENRARFAVECVSAIRSALPQFPIDFKLAVRRENPHYGNAGILQEELPIFVPLLEQAGVTSFHVTLANHGALTDTIPPASHPFYSKEGCFLDFCDALRGLTALPLCGVGGLVHPSFIEEQLQKHRIDCAAMSRQLIADPDWVKKVREGREDSIHYCIRCNQECLGGMQQHRGVHCIYDGQIPCCK